MRARVPNFVKANKANRIVDNNSNYISSNNLSKLMKEKEKEMKKMAPLSAGVAPLSTYHQHHGNSNLYHHHLPSPHHQPQHYSMWHAKSYESGIGKIYFRFLRDSPRALTSLIFLLLVVRFWGVALSNLRAYAAADEGLRTDTPHVHRRMGLTPAHLRLRLRLT